MPGNGVVQTIPAARYWLRAELRRRWRSLLLLCLLVALSCGTVLAATAGARRGASALERLQADSSAATTVVFANTPNFDWDRVRALPQVTSLTTFLGRYAFYFDGIPHSIGLAGHSVATILSGALAPVDDGLFRTIERPVVINGRLFNPARADEVVVTPGFVANAGKGVGDTLTITLPSIPELKAGLDGTGPNLSGPRVAMHIVGVARSPFFTDSADSPGGAVLSAGFVARYSQNTIGFATTPANPAWIQGLVRLRRGEADLPGFRRALASATHRSDLQVWDLPDHRSQAQREIAFEARCLLAFAAAVLIAAMFVIAQTTARYTAVAVDELSGLRGPGITRRQQIALAGFGLALASIAGSLLGGACAVLASRWFPIATAAYVEPHPGVVLDWVVIGPGTALFVLAAVAAIASGAYLAVRRRAAAASNRQSAIAVAAARRGLPVPAVVGTRFALEAGRGITAQPVRPTLVGAVAGIVGVVAALTFAGGVRDASQRPERYGQTWQRGALVGTAGKDFVPSAPVDRVAARDSDVSGVGDIKTASASAAAQHGSVSLFTMARSPKQLPIIVSSGRLPEARDEVLLAPRTLTALHAHLGSTVRFTGDRGTSRYRVVGAGFVPQGDPSHVYSDGGWLTPPGYRRIFGGFQFHFVAIHTAPGRDPTRVADDLQGRIARTFGIPKAQAPAFTATAPPIEILQLRQVRALPIVLGIFLAVLAVAAVGYALATAVRRRASELAVLRALGMTPRQCRAAVLTQAAVTALIGLAVGIPLGVALGRSVWRVVAHYTPLQYVPPGVTAILLLCVPATLLVAGVLTALPGRRAARLRVAHVLRAE